MDPDAALQRARVNRQKIHNRLIDEGETDLAGLLEKCGQPFLLVCTNCGYHHPVETRCRQKWCPVCVRAIATTRSLKFSAAASAMRWPLFVTLTNQNIGDAGIPFIRKLRRDFGKLRHRRIWKENVRGGVAAIEVTNKGKGWHPHLHALVDCEWLAVRTKRPQWGASKSTWRHSCTKAKHEFTDIWKKATGDPHGICWISRAKRKLGVGSINAGADVAREVLKYSVKGSDLVASPDPIGPLIRQMRATRLTTSFGSLFGKNLVRNQQQRPPLICDSCHKPTEWIPDFIAEAILRKHTK